MIKENGEIFGRYILIHGTLRIHNGELTTKHRQFLNIL